MHACMCVTDVQGGDVLAIDKVTTPKNSKAGKVYNTYPVHPRHHVYTSNIYFGNEAYVEYFLVFPSFGKKFRESVESH